MSGWLAGWLTDDEYLQAWYRPQDAWTELIERAGFTRYAGSQEMQRHFTVRSFRHGPEQSFKNLIKAYYAVYVPNKAFRLPRIAPAVIPVVPAAASAKAAAAADSMMDPDQMSAKRTRSEFESLALVPTAPAASKSSSSSSSMRAKDPPGVPEAAEAQDPGQDLYESAKHPGHSYILDSAGKAVWISSIQLNSAPDGSTARGDGSPGGTFTNPITGSVCVIRKIHAPAKK